MDNINIRDFHNKTIHMVGIGGSSMSGLALMLMELGYKVQGSDGAESYIVDMLREKGIEVIVGHSASNIKGANLLAYSAAIAESNPERKAALEQGIPQIERRDLLGQIMDAYDCNICVCGTHGKTTTSAIIAKLLIDAGLDPGVHIGGMADEIGGSTRVGKRTYFVAEACEFRESFMSMRPNIAVLMNVREDHLDYYRDIDHIESTFAKFANKLQDPALLIANGDDMRARRIAKAHKNSVLFGFNNDNDYYPDNISVNNRGCASFDVIEHGKKTARIALSVPGHIQIVDAVAAFAVSQSLNIDSKIAAKSISGFHGVHRRFELTGVYDGVSVYHDYGHNPEEMLQVLQTAKSLPHNRLWAVMQPHTFSRVKRLFKDYIHCTSPADITLVTDICAAREVDPGDIHSTDLVNAMKKEGVNVVYTPSFDDTEKYLIEHWQEGDLVLTMGCGDINKLNIQMEKHLGDKHSSL